MKIRQLTEFVLALTILALALGRGERLQTLVGGKRCETAPGALGL